MNPSHPRWHEFRIMLQGKDGCNFREGENGKVTYNCNDSEDKLLTIKILNTMSDIDVPASLKYFEAHGGCCDFDIALKQFT